MKEIASFTIDHRRLLPGLYVSRVDRYGDMFLTTLDLRLMLPGMGMIPGAAMHTIEHIGATVLRGDEEWGSRVVYFGPMGCATGFYLILAGEFTTEAVTGLVSRVFTTIAGWQGAVPGATASECGNAEYHDLVKARWWAADYASRFRPITTDYPR